MHQSLRFSLELKPHPYPQAADSQHEAWGSIVVSWEAQGKQTLLLATEWDLLMLAEWFAENKAAVCQEILSLEGQGPDPHPAESLAQALLRLQTRAFGNEEAETRWFTTLYRYRERHSLRFALRGASIPEIIIGCNNGTGEISQESSAAAWAYPFPMADFCANLTQTLQQVISTWATTAQESSVRDRVEHLLARLARALSECCS